MQRGFLQNGGYTTDSSRILGIHGREPEHVASLRALLEKEEDRLRQLRQRRLQIENSKVDPPSRVLELPCEGPDEMAMKALALHTEPPPAALHRLGVAVMLVLEAPILVDLGDHPLPSRVPWKNLQILLRKETAPNGKKAGQSGVPMKDIVASLQRPFGDRLARHIQRILGGDPPLTRSEVLELDEACVGLFDWVINLLAPLVKETKSATLGEDPCELRAERESASEAVGQQEKKVAQLRRKLRESVRSVQAATDFAVENNPKRTSEKSASKPLEVTGEKSLQYRLEEVAIPATQEAILQSLVKTLMDPRGTHRCLEVIGHSEDRESDNVAQGRAEAAEAWLLDAGIPSERLTVSWEVGGPAVCRRTDFRLMDVVGSELVMRRKAEDVMKRIFEKQTLHESSERPAPTEGSSRNEGPEQGRSEEDAAPPANPVELKRVVEDAEESSTSSSPTVSMEVSGQQVRLVFKKDDLAPHDAILEVGTKIVRLASQSSSWPQKEVVLPFDVQPEEPAAKFSRRAGQAH
ncbi:unnamed protein product [Durusdinium trenchii]|uniref:OmpA-like domain-containing protein n=1 Tax=Durusdinium trenchii TaxID=1381693 RepID=A0ABP0IYG3_9DINO